MRRTCFVLGLLAACLLVRPVFAASGPVITKDPIDQTTTVGQPVTFSLSVTGTPPLRFQWRRDGLSISNATNGAYALVSAQLGDSGAQFSAIVTNGSGSATSAVATLTVNADNTPPTVVRVRNLTNFTQLMVSFSERVTPGTANNQGNYSLDQGALVFNAAIQGGGSNVLLTVSMLTAGVNYILTVSGILDLATNTIQPNPTLVAFRAAAPPTITTQPQNHAVNPGDSAGFFVVASGTPPLSYQWYKGNALLAGVTGTNYFVTNIQAQTLGNYSVVVSNSAGVVTSAVARLTFLESYTLNLPPGYSFVANQLSNATQGFPTPPDGTAAWKWNEAGQSYDAYTFIGGAGWDPQDLVLTPGEGAVILLPSPTALNFIGERIVPTLPISLTPGHLRLRGAQIPVKGDYQNIVGPPQDGSIVYRYKRGGNPSFFDEYNYTVNYFRNGVWHDGPPTADVGESVFVGQWSPVVINTQPTEHTNISLGQSVSFTVDVSGTPPIHYQWRLNGTAVPGGTNATYSIQAVAIPNGGTYSVAVGNAVGDIASEDARLTLNIPSFGLTDDFSSQGTVNDFSRVLSSHNRSAMRENGEPMHGGKNANASVWLTWVAPATGILTMSCSGSGFDTVLAAYTGNSISNLTLVDFSDDDAGYACSRITFNVQDGVAYRICVAGLGDETGDILLGWNLEDTAQVLPEIGMQPQDQTVGYGDTAQFFVSVNNGAFGYQWYHDGTPISGANGSTLTINNVTNADVGNYYVQIFNAVRSRNSATASLQIEIPEPGQPLTGARAAAKFFDIGVGGTSGTPLKGPRPHKAFGSVNHGFSGAQIVSSAGAANDPSEPLHCGITGGNSVWYTVQASANGTMYVNTDGSTYNTILSAYTGPGYSVGSLVNVTCDNNSGLDGLDSRLSFTATSNTIYYMAVDGVGGTTGQVHIAWHLIRPLSITNLLYTNGFGGRFTMKVNSTSNILTTVQYLTNFASTNWITFTNYTPVSSNGTFNLTNDNAGPSTNRYYRALHSF